MYELTTVTLFAVLLKEIPMTCKDAVPPDPLRKDPPLKSLTFEAKTRKPYNGDLFFFRAQVLPLLGIERLAK